MFYVGQKVVCVNDTWGYNQTPLRMNQVYTIRHIRPPQGMEWSPLGPLDCLLVLSEVSNPDNPNDGFNADRFKPLEEKYKADELFRRIADGVSKGQPIIPDDQYMKRFRRIKAEGVIPNGLYFI